MKEQGRELLGASVATLVDILRAMWDDVAGNKTLHQIATNCGLKDSTVQKYVEVLNGVMPLVGKKAAE